MAVSAGAQAVAVPDLRPLTPPAREGVWCECTVANLDRSREWLIGGYRAPSPRLAVRWLGRQAEHLADLIDPRPDAPWAPEGLVHPVEDPLDVEEPPDPATALRMWSHDVGEHDQALQTMVDGSLYLFTVADNGLRYCLSTRPILTAQLAEQALPAATPRADVPRISRPLPGKP